MVTLMYTVVTALTRLLTTHILREGWSHYTILSGKGENVCLVKQFMNEMQSNGQEPFAMRSIANSENDGQKF